MLGTGTHSVRCASHAADVAAGVMGGREQGQTQQGWCQNLGMWWQAHPVAQSQEVMWRARGR